MRMRSFSRVKSVDAERAASDVISPAPFSWKREGRKKVTLHVCGGIGYRMLGCAVVSCDSKQPLTCGGAPRMVGPARHGSAQS